MAPAWRAILEGARYSVDPPALRRAPPRLPGSELRNHKKEMVKGECTEKNGLIPAWSSLTCGLEVNQTE